MNEKACRMGRFGRAIAVAGVGWGVFWGAGADASAGDPPSANAAQTAIASGTSEPTRPVIDESALAILRKSDARMLSLKTYQAEGWITNTQNGRKYYIAEKVAAARPNLMRYDAWETTGPGPSGSKRQSEMPLTTFVYDGKTSWIQAGRTYRSLRRDRVNVDILSGFYNVETSLYSLFRLYRKNGLLLEARHDGTESVDGTLCDKVFTHIRTFDKAQEHRTTYYVGRSDALVHRKVSVVKAAAGTSVQDTESDERRRIVVNAPIRNPAAVFTYAPPKGVVPYTPPQGSAPPHGLLPNGTIAPDFTATDKNGKSIRLSDYRGKVVILDLWASWCPPCVASMPHNQAVVKKLQREKLPVVMLALDNFEKRDAFLKWVKNHPEMNAITFVYADPEKARIEKELYPAAGIPTQYIIDAKGIIRDALGGYGGPTDVLEKAVRKALKRK